MDVLITGTSSGIGRATAELFLERGHAVTGFDVAPASIKHKRYRHFLVDVSVPSTFPEGLEPEIIVNNAGVQGTARDIAVNLQGTINITERYAFAAAAPGQNELQAAPAPYIRSVVNVGSASGHTGSEFPAYAASKGGVVAYTKNVAMRLAPQATCNSVDPGGVTTELNACVMEDEKLWNRIMELTPLKRWATPREIAEWIYFVSVTNTFMTGQNLLIDGGEAGRTEFVWPNEA